MIWITSEKALCRCGFLVVWPTTGGSDVEMNVGAQTYSGDFADYKDFQEYGVMFPSRISQKIDGAPVAEFTVSEALANPYLIFPPPKELKP